MSSIMLTMLDAVSHKVFIGNLILVDAVHLATTCKELKKIHLWVLVFPDRVTVSDLNIHQKYRLSDAVVASLTSLLSASITCINVEGCSNLTDEAIKTLTAKCSLLTKLNVSYCRITTLEVIAANCPALKDLDVSSSADRSENLTDASLQASAVNCPDLPGLAVSMCCSLTDKSIKAIAAKCPLLTSISLDYCKITDDAIYAIVKNCPSLTSISVDCCPNLIETSRIHKLINY